MNLFLILLLFFTVVPLVELTLLLYLSDAIGWLPTIAVVLITGVIGASLAKMQGWQTYSRIQQELSTGKMPTDALADGLMIIIAGAFLVTPGILTDAAGFSLLIPQIRRVVQRVVMLYLKTRMELKMQSFNTFDQQQPDAQPIQDAPDIIDVTYTRKVEE